MKRKYVCSIYSSSVSSVLSYIQYAAKFLSMMERFRSPVDFVENCDINLDQCNAGIFEASNVDYVASSPCFAKDEVSKKRSVDDFYGTLCLLVATLQARKVHEVASSLAKHMTLRPGPGKKHSEILDKIIGEFY